MEARSVRAFCPLVVFLLVAAAVAGCVLYPPTFHFLVKVFLHIHSLGEWGLLVFFLCYPVALAVGFPVTLLDMVVGFLYEWAEALAVVWVGKTVGSAVCYWLAGSIFKQPFAIWAERNSLLRELTEVLRMHPWKYCFLFRLIFIPATLKNYGLAALQTPFLPYIISSTSLDLVTSLWLVLVGDEGKLLYQSGHARLGRTQLVWMIVAAGGSLAAMIVLVLYTRTVLHDLHALSEALAV